MHCCNVPGTQLLTEPFLCTNHIFLVSGASILQVREGWEDLIFGAQEIFLPLPQLGRLIGAKPGRALCVAQSRLSALESFSAYVTYPQQKCCYPRVHGTSSLWSWRFAQLQLAFEGTQESHSEGTPMLRAWEQSFAEHCSKGHLLPLVCFPGACASRASDLQQVLEAQSSGDSISVRGLPV